MARVPRHRGRRILLQPFIPASFNLPLLWTADFLHPILLKAMQNISDVVVQPEDKALLRSLRDERVLLFTNHPSTAEPPIVYGLANMMGARFKYMASRQVFDWNFGLVGKAISQIGAYSVIAGIADREAIKATREALAAPQGKLVLFPEGEPTSGENDSLMPFQPGIAQLGFWGLEDARKTDPNADIVVLPGFIKYVVQGYPDEIATHLASSIEKMEEKLGIDPGHRNLLRRFLHFGKVLLEKAEHEYGIKPGNHDFDYRIGRVRHAILDGIADRFEVKNFDRKADAIIKLRQLFALLEMISIGYPDPNLPKVTPQDVEWAHRECVKAFDFVVIKRDYLVTNPTPERFYEWLARFESYVWGKTPRALGGEPSPVPRKAYVTFAKPFRMSEYHSEDRKKKRGNVDVMMKRLRTDIQKLLDDAMKHTKPLVAPNDIGGE